MLGNRPVLRLIIQRVVLAFIALVIVASIVFWTVALLPGDTAERLLGRDATPAALEALRQQLQLNLSPVERFGIWLKNVAAGNLGTSMASGSPVLPYVQSHLVNTLLLAGLALVLHIPLSISLGLLLANVKRNGPTDSGISVLVLFGMSIPEFVVAIVLVGVFSTSLGWFPPLALIDQARGFWDTVWMLALPALVLNAAITAYVVRQTRGAMISIMHSDYVRMARLRGLSSFRVVFVHALPTALGPVINAIALNSAWLVGGVVVVETIFNYPGLGRLLVEAISTRDVPMIQGASMALSATYIVLNLVADVCTLLLNPKLRGAA